MSATTESQNIPHEQPWLNRYDTIQKISNYQTVTNAVEYGKGWYNYAKEKSTLLKNGLEMTEHTVEMFVKPLQNGLEKMDSVIIPLDKMTSSTIEKIETSASTANDKIFVSATDLLLNVDSKLSSIVNYGSKKIEGTVLNDYVNSSGQIINIVVDNILPPPEGEDLEHMNEDELFEMEKRAKFLLKLRKRTNLSSIKSAPGNSINSLIKLTKNIGNNEIKHFTQTIDSLKTTSARVQQLTFNKTNVLTKVFVDGVYEKLDSIVAASGAVLLWVKKIDPTEAIVSIQELRKMIIESKERVMETVETSQKLNQLKNDCARIMERTSEIVNQQIDSTMDKLKKSEYVLFRNSAEIISDLSD